MSNAYGLIAGKQDSVRIGAVLAGFLLVLSLLSCGFSEPPTRAAVLAELEGIRCLQPRVDGLTDPLPCSTSADLIPSGHCGPCLNPRQTATLKRLVAQLESNPQPETAGDRLHGAAVGRLFLGFNKGAEGLVKPVVPQLQEALDREDSPSRRAQILSDLAAAHWVRAQNLQDPLEAAFAWEHALHALELSPDNETAHHNALLAALLFGASIPERSKYDPWLANLGPALAENGSGPRPSPCLVEAEIGAALDTWSKDLSHESWMPLAKATECLANQNDRYYLDLLTEAAEHPNQTARLWMAYREAERSLYGLSVEEVKPRLAALESLKPPPPLKLAGLRLEAILHYQALDYEKAVHQLEELANESSSADFHGLAGEAHRLLALIAQIRGRIGEALDRLDRAQQAAEQTHSPMLNHAIAGLRIDLLKVVGREDQVWRHATRVLKDRRRPILLRVMTCRALAGLARERNLNRVARAFHDLGVELSGTLGPVPEISSLRTRGELLSDLGWLEAARADLETAQKRLAEEDIDPAIAGMLKDDLLLLEGRVTRGPAARIVLEKLVEAYQASDYDHRILLAQLQLARLSRREGDLDAAFKSLEEAFSALQEQVRAAGGWANASALTASARPLLEEWVDLAADHLKPEELFRIVSKVLAGGTGSFTGQKPQRHRNAPLQRLTTFVLPNKVVLLLENQGILTMSQQVVSNTRLSELRDRLLLQLQYRADERRWMATARQLADLLLAPVIDQIDLSFPLTVVADSKLAGLPFHLLPVDSEDSLLIDHLAVQYATDLQTSSSSRHPQQMLVVGISNPGGDLRPLPFADPEAHQVASMYGTSDLLINPTHTSDLAARLNRTDGVHIAGHFIVNTRSPLDSVLPLSRPEHQELTLSQILQPPASGPRRLLYFSACDSGRGLPPTGQGFASLAHAFVAAGVGTTVLSLWPLNDEIAPELAVTFHRRLDQGEPPSEALRAAQLRHRFRHPGDWAPLVVFQ